MRKQPSHKVVLSPRQSTVLRSEFLAWQCRIRQLAVREDGGRPSQLCTGHLADRIGRKRPVVCGFLLLAGGIAVTALGRQAPVWLLAAAVMGIGMALLYPNLIAAMSDRAPPLIRGKALGTYRYWPDIGYAVGAVLLGAVAQIAHATVPTIWLTAAIVASSGLWIAVAVEEDNAARG